MYYFDFIGIDEYGSSRTLSSDILNYEKYLEDLEYYTDLEEVDKNTFKECVKGTSQEMNDYFEYIAEDQLDDINNSNDVVRIIVGKKDDKILSVKAVYIK